MQSFLDVSSTQQNEKTLLLDISAIPLKEDIVDDDLIQQQLMILQQHDPIKEKDNDELIVKSARILKRKVINQLEQYSQILAHKDNSIRKLISTDLKWINQEYQELLTMADEVESLSNEVQTILKLVGEFLQQMTYKQQERTVMQISKTTSEQVRRTNRTNTYQTISNDSFQKQKSLPLYQQQTINNSVESDESTSVPGKTLAAINAKIAQLINELKNQEIYSRILILAKEILENSDNMETFKLLRQQSKQFEQPEVKKLVKACYLKSLVQEQNQNNTSKREFYDIVIKIKSQAPENNKIHSMMISSLYEEVLKKGVPNNQWESYMKSLCN